jgi:predicted enzyme related to lactoylglutathione lyase
MDFISIRIITEDLNRLVSFYEQVTGSAATRYSEDFAELKTGLATIAIAHRRTAERFAAGAVHPADNHSVILEFRVRDVDADRRRLAPLLGQVVQEPTTMPWGNRSLLFRDPDGNLVNLFTPVSREAIDKFAERR